MGPKFKDGIPYDYSTTYGKLFFKGLMPPQEADADDLSGESAFKGQRYRIESSGQRGLITVRLPVDTPIREFEVGAEVRLVEAAPNGWAKRVGSTILAQMTHGAKDIVLVRPNGSNEGPSTKPEDKHSGPSSYPPKSGDKPTGSNQQNDKKQ